MAHRIKTHFTPHNDWHKQRSLSQKLSQKTKIGPHVQKNENFDIKKVFFSKI